MWLVCCTHFLYPSLREGKFWGSILEGCSITRVFHRKSMKMLMSQFLLFFFNIKSRHKIQLHYYKDATNFLKIRGIRFLFKGDSWSNIYDYLNHAVHNLLQFWTKLVIMEKGLKESPTHKHCHTVLTFKVLYKSTVVSSQHGETEALG